MLGLLLNSDQIILLFSVSLIIVALCKPVFAENQTVGGTVL